MKQDSNIVYMYPNNMSNNNKIVNIRCVKIDDISNKCCSIDIYTQDGMFKLTPLIQCMEPYQDNKQCSKVWFDYDQELLKTMIGYFLTKIDNTSISDIVGNKHTTMELTGAWLKSFHRTFDNDSCFVDRLVCPLELENLFIVELLVCTHSTSSGLPYVKLEWIQD